MTGRDGDGLDEERLRAELARTLGAPAARIVVVDRARLKSGVYRLRLDVQGDPRTVVAKRLAPELAVRNRLVVERWLPAAGLQDLAAPLLALIAEPRATWLVSADLGPSTLQTVAPDPARVDAAVERIALLHRTFVDHALLGELRLWGGNFGPSFLADNLRDAERALGALRARLTGAPERAALCTRLLARLAALAEDVPRRAELVRRWGGPETLVHGDLWPGNLVEVPQGSGLALRLIDWDHAGVGPPLYDLSTFLYRFAPSERRRVWEVYRDAFGPGPWRFPAEPELALLCETAEHARLANSLIWPALAALRGDASACDDLIEIEGWFEELLPLLS